MKRRGCVALRLELRVVHGVEHMTPPTNAGSLGGARAPRQPARNQPARNHPRAIAPRERPAGSPPAIALGAPQAGIQRVAEAVAEEVEAQDGDHDGEARDSGETMTPRMISLLSEPSVGEAEATLGPRDLDHTIPRRTGCSMD
jgi:hypothetical protein